MSAGAMPQNGPPANNPNPNGPPANNPPATDPNNPPNPDPNADPDDDDDDDGEGNPPPNAEADRLRRVLAKIKKERATLRQQLAAARQGGQPGTPPANQPPPADPDLHQQTDNRVRRAGAIAALTEAGMTRAQAKRALPLMDLDSVEIDEDGDGDYDDAITDLKDMFPQLFPAGNGAPPPRNSTRPQGGSGGGGAHVQRDRAGNVIDETTRRLLRQGGYGR